MIKIQENIKLAPYTTFRIGGEAKFFVKIYNADELIEALSWAEENNQKYFILGGGSNVLFPDEGYDGLVIKMAGEKIQVLDNEITIDSGISLNKAVVKALAYNLSGLEWAIGIPGTVGGAIRGNAGAHDFSISDFVKEVSFFDSKEIWTFKKADLDFSYRSSIFKKNKHFVVLTAVLELQLGGDSNKDLLKNYIIKRNESQPKGFSAGSVFKNPPDNYAGKLIEACGLKNSRIGGAIISDKHANFIINMGNANAKDVLALVDLCQKEVFNKFNINLELEIEIVG
jgi:UDP-N-acetylmuramate dehydrogenase